jgi:hypothetical protein
MTSIMTSNQKKIGIGVLFCGVIIVLGTAVFFLTPPKKDLSIINAQGTIQQSMTLTRQYQNGEEAIYHSDTIHSAEAAVPDNESSGESSLSLMINGQAQTIVGYIDSNTKKYSLELKVVDFEEATGRLVMAVTYVDGLNDHKREFVFE